MKHKLLAAAALALASAAPAGAADFIVTYGSAGTHLIPPTFPGDPSDNAFAPDLAAEGLFSYANFLTSIFLDGPARISVDFMGAESAYDDTFTLAGQSYTETFDFARRFPGVGCPGPACGPLHLFDVVIDGTGPINLLGLMGFSGPGALGGIGDEGMGMFLAGNSPLAAIPTGGLLPVFQGNVIYLGYDDQNGNGPLDGDDDNHDDMIIRLTATAVPESATWAMLLSGFAVIGAAMRRRSSSVRRMQAV